MNRVAVMLATASVVAGMYCAAPVASAQDSKKEVVWVMSYTGGGG